MTLPWRWPTANEWALVVILLTATALRGLHLGRPSLYYDEIVTMQLAREPNPAALVRLMDRIDASRAPLQPLLLHGWIGVFGPSDVAGRAFSAACGVLTVLLIYLIGRQAFDEPTGLWGAWLGAMSPALVRYSQEIRMYAWLVLAVCLSWALLLSFRRSAPFWRKAAYALTLVALIYTHPLSLFMIAAQHLTFYLHRAAFRLSWRDWLGIQVAWALGIAPWVGQYLRNSPEYLLERLPIQFLIGLPIGYIGGNKWTLPVCAALIAWGLVKRVEGRWKLDEPAESSALLFWFFIPPLVLYAYSWVARPIFGLTRYTLFVAPAYLLLVARGLRKLPLVPRLAAAAGGVALSGAMLATSVYDVDAKADWRAAAALIAQRDPRAHVLVLSPDPERPHFDLATARYYLPPGVKALGLNDLREEPTAPGTRLWVALRTERGQVLSARPDALADGWNELGVWDVPGLRLIWEERR